METFSVFTLLLCFVYNIQASLITSKIDLCGPIMNLVLDQFDESSATIALISHDRFTTKCNLKITAPKTHVIHLKIIDNDFQQDSFRYSGIDSCHLNVYQEGNHNAVWSADPCTDNILPDIDLLHPEVTIEWSPPLNSVRTQGRKLLVTAVGRGKVCNDSLQHTCMSIGHEPLFCISKYLICDGNQNCPKGATRNDEDERMCKVTLLMLFKQVKNTELNDKILNLIMTKSTKSPKSPVDWRDWTIIQKAEDLPTLGQLDKVSIQGSPVSTFVFGNRSNITTIAPTTEQPSTNIESLSAALSHYGPWGYILLGMLICGTVLMFCGVWECFKKPKPTPDLSTTPPPSVLIINQREDNGPPRYEDLDPPSYAMLFPNFKDGDTVLVQSAEIVSTSESDAISANGNETEIGVTIDHPRASSSGLNSVNTEIFIISDGDNSPNRMTVV